MKKVGVTLGIGILAFVLLSFALRNNCENDKADFSSNLIEDNNPFAEGLRLEAEVASLKVEDIILIEVEEEVTMEFDVASYLPKGFNAYQGMIIANNPLSEFTMEETDLDNFTEEAVISIAEAYHVFAEGMQLEKKAANLRVEDITLIEVEEEFETINHQDSKQDFIFSRM